MIKHYQYSIEGTDGNGQVFTLGGTVRCVWDDLLHAVTADAYNELTGGRAIFGKPGVRCRGPYDFHTILIEQVKQ